MNIRRSAHLLATCLLGFSATVFAAADGSPLPLPEGAKVAVVVFEDLQCPDCARAHPELLKVTEANKVPLVIRDFPITPTRGQQRHHPHPFRKQKNTGLANSD